MKIVLKIFLAIIITRTCFAVTDEYIFKQFTDVDGLSQSTIFATLQDKLGYLWFGTIDGLNRFDGYEFRVHKNNPNDTTSISDNFISALYEDEDGYIWIGTVNGFLNRFDRKSERFTRYFINNFFERTVQPDPTYYDYPLAFSRNQVNSITTIAEDAAGQLWIGTWGNGIIRFNKTKETGLHIYHDPNFENGLSSNRITEILRDKNDNIWIATFGSGIDKYLFTTDITLKLNSSGQYTFLNYSKNPNAISGLNDNSIITLFNDRDDNLWIGTYHGGLNLLTAEYRDLPADKAVFKNFTAKADCDDCLCNNTVMAIVQDFDDYLWIGTFGSGVDRFDYSSGIFTHYNSSPDNPNTFPDSEILSIFIDRSGIIWIGSHLGEGVTKLQKNPAKFELINRKTSAPFRLNDDVVWSVYRDSQKNLWIGTYRGGVNVVNFETKQVTTYTHNPADPKSLGNNHIRSIEEDNFGNIWIGTYNSGVNRFNPKTKKFDVFRNEPDNANSLSANQVLDIVVESDTVIWIATFGGGLNKLSFSKYSSENILLFTHYKNDPEDTLSIPDNRVYVIHRDKKNIFWVGTYGGGLSKFDPVDGKFQNLIREDVIHPLNVDKILCILDDSDGTIWVGTSGSGLCRLNRDNYSFYCYSKNEGLNSAVVYGILEDNQGNLWLSTDDGIFSFNRKTGKFTQFGIEDGIQSNEFSGGAYYQDSDGIIYFGGINGLNFFNPEDIVTRSYIPPVVITAVSIFNNRLEGEFDELILSYDQNFISFNFASLDFSNPKRNLYSYILEGFEQKWQTTDHSRRAAFYTNLPAGKYRFHVIGSNRDGIWNEEGAVLNLIINPPYWQTWWFITLIVLMVAFLIYYTSTVKIKNQLAIEKLKTKIASDLHDNVGSGLTEISILSEVANQKLNKASVQLSSELKNISDTARELVDNMSDIVWVVNPQRDSLHDLIIKLKDSYNDFLESVGISFQVKNIDKTNDIRLSMDFKQNLLLMFKEAINNSIKHSFCSNIILEASIKNETITLTVSDDGTGFHKNKIKLGNGMRNIKERALRIGGTLTWETTPGEGTKVTFVGRVERLLKLKSLLSLK